MLYRENGQFKTTYRADQQLLPITQDRFFVWGVVVLAFLLVPLLASDYAFRALIVPFLILAIAAIGLNILVGYCGQISLGHAAFMAVGAYAAYNLVIRVPGLNFLVVLVLAGLVAALVGIAFGVPSLRIKGLYLAVATLAAQFFVDWACLRLPWVTNGSSSGSVSVAGLNVLGLPIVLDNLPYWFGIPIDTALSAHLTFMVFGALIVFFLIVEPHGIARLWSTGKEKLRLWPFPH